MKHTGPSRWYTLINSLPGRIGLVILTTVVITAVIPLIFFYNQTIIPAALKFIAIACVGIVSGFAARRLLRTSTRVLSMLAAFIAVYASLWLLSALTAGYIGIQPFLSGSGPNWSGLVQLALGTVFAWLVLQAWRGPIITGARPAAPARARSQPAPSAAPRKKKIVRAAKRKRKIKRTSLQRKPLSLLAIQLPPFTTLNYWNAKIALAQTSLQASWIKLSNILRQPVHRANSLLPSPRVRTKTPSKSIQLRTRKPKTHPPKKTRTSVRLTGAIDHRCPFCLETVAEKDPRGVKVCSLCHTHHHADCWAVTGSCQVPHIHG